MAKCKTCGKLLLGSERKYCGTCNAFHKFNYSRDERQMLLSEYERSGQ